MTKLKTIIKLLAHFYIIKLQPYYNISYKLFSILKLKWTTAVFRVITKKTVKYRDGMNFLQLNFLTLNRLRCWHFP